MVILIVKISMCSFFNHFFFLSFLPSKSVIRFAFSNMNPVWNDRSISLSSKIRLMRSLVTSIILYACESWTLRAELQRRIQAMEMRCYRKVLCISYTDHVTNKEVCAKVQQAIRPHKNHLTIVKRRILQWLSLIHI